MRIVIDMQGVQSKGYSYDMSNKAFCFAKAIVSHRGGHEVFLALNGRYLESVERIRTEFDSVLPQDNIRVWFPPKLDSVLGRPVCEVGELINESFLASMEPDVIHFTDLPIAYGRREVASGFLLASDVLVSVSLFDVELLIESSDHLKAAMEAVDGRECNLGGFRQPQLFLTASGNLDPHHLVKLNIPAEKVFNIAPKDISCSLSDEALMKGEARNGPYSLAFSDALDKFWGQCAIASISLFEASRCKVEVPVPSVNVRPRLAFVSPLPPEKSGIADYSSDLIPALAKYYDVEVVVAQDRVDVSWIGDFKCIRDADWLRSHAGDMDRVIYHVGNSPLHQFMLYLIADVPGTIVLHDFYLGHLLSSMEAGGHVWTEELYSAHGYSAVRERFLDAGLARLKYPVNLSFLQWAEGVIVHSEYSKGLARQWYGDDFVQGWEVIPLLRAPASLEGEVETRKKLGLAQDDFVVCSFGFLGSTKLNDRLLQAWLDSALARDIKCKLYFVGENPAAEYGNKLISFIDEHDLSGRVHITGFASQEMYSDYLKAADMAVQLRGSSRGETSAAVLDCMNYALPLIVNANGSMAELDKEAVYLLPDDFDDSALVCALESLWRDSQARQQLAERSRDVILERHDPEKCALEYYKAIERFQQLAKKTKSNLIRAIAEQENFKPSGHEILQFSKSISISLPPTHPKKRLMLDVSATCRNDLKTGIERVVRALLVALLESPPEGYRVEPVYLCSEGGEWKYRAACSYAMSIIECPAGLLYDDVIEPVCGDILVTMDLSGDLLIQAHNAGLFDNYRAVGVRVYSTVFDLLPVRMPNVFPHGADKAHQKWLDCISSFDGAICISRSVADDLEDWLDGRESIRSNRRPFAVKWFHLGADVSSSAPSLGLPESAFSTLEEIRARPSFLMVGTIEPRKGYLQVVQAFSKLWRDGVDVNLVVVGKEGWKGISGSGRRDIPETIDLLRNHDELGRRLFWLEGVSDEYLEAVYDASTCLIAASYGEGFGLPLIEAAKAKLPIVARDIPVFREVAGDGAFYFSSRSADGLSDAITNWLTLQGADSHPKSSDIDWMTWQQSVSQLISALL